MDKLRNIWRGILSDPLRLHVYEDARISSRRSEARITYWVNSGYKTNADSDNKLYLWMFGEDIHLRVMPYSRKEAVVSLCPSDKAMEQKLAKELGDEYSYSLQDVIEDFVRTATQIIYSYGDVYYEIEPLKSKDATGPRFKLELIYTPSMKKIFGQYFQIITPRAAKHAHIKMGIIKVPRQRLLHISSPSHLGGNRSLKKIMKGLLSHGGTPLPRFLMEAIESGNNTGFNIDEHQLNRYIYRALLTKDFGWSQRNDTNAPILEYYWLTRLLRQARAMVLIREHIVKKLNEALNVYLEDGQKVHIKGPYDLNDIKEAQIKLKQGNVEINELVKKFL